MEPASRTGHHAGQLAASYYRESFSPIKRRRAGSREHIIIRAIPTAYDGFAARALRDKVAVVDPLRMKKLELSAEIGIDHREHDATVLFFICDAQPEPGHH
jgi:hypothetical protein